MRRYLLTVANSALFDANVMWGSFANEEEAGKVSRKEEFRIR